MTPDEIEQMARAHELIFISGCKPIRTRKYNLREHPHYRFCGEADKKNHFNIRSLVPYREIDYEILDEAALTVQKVKDFDFEGLAIEKGHKRGYVLPDKWRDISVEKLMEACNVCKLSFEKGREAAYYIRMLDKYEKEIGRELNPQNPLEGFPGLKDTDGNTGAPEENSLSHEAQARVESRLQESAAKLGQRTETAFAPYLAALRKHLEEQNEERREEAIDTEAYSIFL